MLQSSEPSRDKDPPGWPAGYPPFQQMMANWRMQFPANFEPPRGGPPGSGFPFPPMFYMPYGMPPNMQQGQQQQQSKDKQDEEPTEHNTNKTKFAPLKEDQAELDRKAAAQAKLKRLEETRLKRQDVKLEDLEQSDQPVKSRLGSESEDVLRPPIRSRNDSEASDSSRRSNKDIPPRFQRKRSGQNEVNVDEIFPMSV